jgi:cobyrinic acid a,c-diamide synthase
MTWSVLGLPCASGSPFAMCRLLKDGLKVQTHCHRPGKAGSQYPMVGVFPFKTRMLPRLKALGYREVVATKPTFITAGEKIRGHEFHYSELCGSIPGEKIETVYSMEGPP